MSASHLIASEAPMSIPHVRSAERPSSHCRIWICLVCGLTLNLLLNCPSVTKAQQFDTDPVLEAWADIDEVVSRAMTCHYRASPRPVISKNRLDGSGVFSRGTELRDWVNNDKHAIARLRVEPLTAEEVRSERERLRATYQSLTPEMSAQWVGESNELSRAICNQLGFDVATKEGYAQFAKSCLTCHGGYSDVEGVKERFNHPKFASAAQQPGVSCGYCHQERGDALNDTANRDWINQHWQLSGNSWRTLPPMAKASAGMRDVVSVHKQASLCNDCHIGNIGKNMFVTHQMYAAGHPPLPNVELETFNRAMPQHWRSQGDQIEAMAEGAPEIVDEYLAANFPGVQAKLNTTPLAREDVYWNTRALLIGALMAKKHATDLVFDASKNPKDAWGDFALYDCGACHHELKQPSLRQQRGYEYAPGRPRLYEWSDALFVLLSPNLVESSGIGSDQVVDDVVFHTDDQLIRLFREVSKQDRKLAETVAEQPFGRKLDVKPAAERLSKLLDALVGSLRSEVAVDANLTLRLIERFSEAGEFALLDYGTARQVLWAISIMTEELQQDKNRPASADAVLPVLRREVEQWRKAPTNDGTLISVGSVGIAAELPAGRNMFIYRDNLNDELVRRADYHPERFAASLRRIHEAFDRRGN